MTKIAKFGTIAVAAMLLAGCQSSPFSGWGVAKKQNKRPAAEAPPEIVGAQLIEEGRAQLRDGHISAAVATLRLARLDPATAAAAENGLGVAYAKLGRFDIADRYFRAAVARDPQDMRFTANLLRLQRHVMLARKATGPAKRVAAAPVPKADPAPLAMRPHRISDGIVKIATREQLGDGPRMTVAFLEKPSLERETEAEPKLQDEQSPATDLGSEDEGKQKLVSFTQ